MPLYRYQSRWAQYVRGAVDDHRNETICVEMPRQSGKNEASAHIELGILAKYGRRGGGVVKCAPTWKPQIVNSKLRFDHRRGRVNERLKFLNIRPREGYMFQCENALVQFLSADPKAAVVGATASLLMEVDESQDVDKAKYDKEFAPMRASTGAPVVHYGTTWTDDTLLEREKQAVKDGRARGRIFRVTPDEVAAENPAYGDFVDAETRRLGRNHPIVKTQYYLEALAGQGRMLSDMQLRMMIGDHERRERRTDEAQIVAGLDFAGADENAGDLVSLATGSQRDSVALTIGSVQWATVATGIVVPIVRILWRGEWLNVNPVSLHTALYRILWEKWRVDRAHCDATGIGATSTAFLASAINKSSDRVFGKLFDSVWNLHTDLAFGYLAAINGGRIQDYAQRFDPLAAAGQESPDESDPDRHAWWQRGHARLEAKPGKKVRAYVPESEGHDDILISDMLMYHAAEALGRPQVVTSGAVNFYG